MEKGRIVKASKDAKGLVSRKVLTRHVSETDEEETRAAREGLDGESLAVFDLQKKPDLSPLEIKRIKDVAVALLETLKAEKVRIDHWRGRAATL